jgi:hypothetical protein
MHTHQHVEYALKIGNVPKNIKFRSLISSAAGSTAAIRRPRAGGKVRPLKSDSFEYLVLDPQAEKNTVRQRSSERSASWRLLEDIPGNYLPRWPSQPIPAPTDTKDSQGRDHPCRSFGRSNRNQITVSSTSTTSAPRLMTASGELPAVARMAERAMFVFHAVKRLSALS